MFCRHISVTSRVLLLLLTLGYDENSCDAGKTTVLWRQWLSAMGVGVVVSGTFTPHGPE